jgi:hypothetical protein
VAKHRAPALKQRVRLQAVDQNLIQDGCIDCRAPLLALLQLDAANC